jgi:membrane-associated PAP2 superfamily phosphatase
MTATDSRPGTVSTAVWLLLAGSALLLFGGLMAAFVSYDALRLSAPPTVSDGAVRNYARLYRGAGILFSIAAVALGALAIRARDRDPRFRRTAMTLGLTIVVLVGLAAVFAGTHILALLSLVPIVVGTLLLSRPQVVEWYAGE